jgi:AcrR family transcriptional regulator
MANAGYLQGPERRKRILEGAKRVFATRGYHDTNISHICDDLGIARGTLYLYFENKKAVFVSIIEDMLARLQAELDSTPPLDLRPGIAPTLEQIIRFSAADVHRMLRAIFEDEDSLRLLVREAVGLDVHIDAIVHAIDDIVITRFAADLALAQKAGIVRADVDPRRAALFVMGGIQKLALDALQREARPIDLEALALEATRLHMTGLLSPEIHTRPTRDRKPTEKKTEGSQ